MKDIFESLAVIVGSITIVFVTLLIVPFVSFWCGYFGGWLCSLVIGDTLASGLNSLFNVTYFTKDMIPLCAATLGWIGGHFKCRSTTVKKEYK